MDDKTARLPFEPTREAGLARLEAAAPRMGSHYREHRNHDLGPDDRSNVSTLSPWLTHRLVTEHEVVARAVADHGRAAPEKFVQEVFWRTYWKGWLEMRPQVWRAYEERRDRAFEAVERNGGMRRDYFAAVEGRTGIEGFDDWAVELARTGYLHNHARMWFASIWIHTLRLDWALGADLFYRHLVDGDPASNTLGWRWVAGIQTRGKPYAATRDNIRRFTNGRYDPRGLDENPSALEGDVDTRPEPIEPLRPNCSGRAVLLVHAADCRAEELRSPGAEIVAVAGVADPASRSPAEVSNDVTAFVRGAVQDGIRRAGEGHGVEATSVADAEEIAALVRSHEAAMIVTPQVPVGDTRDRVDGLRGALGRNGIELFERRRDWDARAWPYATKGFFKFKERIPQLMRDASL